MVRSCTARTCGAGVDGRGAGRRRRFESAPSGATRADRAGARGRRRGLTLLISRAAAGASGVCRPTRIDRRGVGRACDQFGRYPPCRHGGACGGNSQSVGPRACWSWWASAGGCSPARVTAAHDCRPSLANAPSLILADEPTPNLDLAHQLLSHASPDWSSTPKRSTHDMWATSGRHSPISQSSTQSCT
jgi:hypothetical protein